MSLPNPPPDDPKKWSGWKNYSSENFYERLCLRYEEHPTAGQIEENCRLLLTWWQKKLPLKNQPSNPIAQMLRGGLDDAPHYLSEARAALINTQSRSKLDALLTTQTKQLIHAEFSKFLEFSIANGALSNEAEERLLRLGRDQGLTEEEIESYLDSQLELRGAVRAQPPAAQSASTSIGSGGNSEDEFLRVLNLAGLEDGEMTDDQRDAFVNMAENLGIQPGHAEDMIDEWIDEQAMGLIPAKQKPPGSPPPVASKNKAEMPAKEPVITKSTPSVRNKPAMTQEEEIREFRPFTNRSGMEMKFIPGMSFFMGSSESTAQSIERPAHRVHLARFFISRFPITNDQYELYSLTHRAKRLRPEYGDHPVVYVSSFDAIKFCAWLSAKEGVKYRLPTEAEWEAAARGEDERAYPWGNHPGSGNLANFADCRTSFAWSDQTVDDGFAETSPVGSYPRGASPFGVEDMAGNVHEWCSDFFDSYSSRERINPKGGINNSKRVFRGGSWRSRFFNLRAVSRSFNSPEYSFNDLGFRVVCDAILP